MSDCEHRLDIKSIEREAAELERDGVLSIHDEDAIADEIDELERLCADECFG